MDYFDNDFGTSGQKKELSKQKCEQYSCNSNVELPV